MVYRRPFKLTLGLLLFLLLLNYLLLLKLALAGEITLQTDQSVPMDTQIQVPEKKAVQGNQESTRSSNLPPDEKTALLLRMKQDQLLRLDASLEEEEQIMASVVQIMDRESAAHWLSSFISARPLNCPIKQQRVWVEAIIQAAEKNRLPVCKEILALTAVLVSVESSFQVDPPAVDQSKGEDMRAMLDRAEKELYEKFGPLMSIPPVPQLYALYKDKYYPRLVTCHTEGAVEAVARSIADDLKKDAEHLPAVIRNAINKEVDKLANIVRTKGSMQLNFPRARQVMQERGERYTDPALTEYMYTMNGGVDVGVAALRPMFVQYAARHATPGNLSWLFFVGMDYNYGPFSSRNMMEQVRIRDLSGRKIAIDGDFLQYDDNGLPIYRESDTLAAATSVFPATPKANFWKAFLLEKDQHYAYTEAHQAIEEAHREKFGETPFAVIGELWMGETAQVKHGHAWKTRAYLNKLDRLLNSIPWD
ncbi:MAG: DUF1615 family protein [Desulfomonile tiedjei]|uniref:DUF1615 family protein n=1 Tax=Desulfomonile tiedjei TaxID=2358 RepID=A0A9D6V0F4_9BACT|nr:DUF1615 family protein [Desulfomonile tiedjei]